MSSIGPLKGEALHQAIEVAVLRKGLDTAEMEGEAAVQLIEQAGDVVAPQKVASPAYTHLGQMLDTYI